MEKICVAIRVRPPIKQDLLKGSLWKVGSSSVTLCNNIGTPISGQSYNFDHVFDSRARNADIYCGLTKDVIMSAVNGFNGTVFAYGQTSSGKTYTMKGSDADRGIIGLAVRDVFNEIQKISSREFLIRVSYMEIYNEEINDLLAPENRKLQIHENFEKGIFVAGLREEIVDSSDHVLELLQFGDSHRHFGETSMNLYSSRSHTIFRMVIESRDKSQESNESEANSDAVRVSALNMVDLAGSERISKTGAGGVRLKEGTHINKSLMTLGTVINKLSEGGKHGGHIPYRDSKLTRILQPALGGNARTAMICTVTPDEVHIDETRGTLQFASRAKRVTNCAQVNEILTDAALLKRQTKEIEDLRLKLQGLPQSEHLEKEILTLRNELLKFELERERLSLELQEEKKAQAERERRIKEQEQKIENLSSLFMSSALEDRDWEKLGRKNNRRETWCPRQLNPELVKETFRRPSGLDSEDSPISIKFSSLRRERNLTLPPAFETLLDEGADVTEFEDDFAPTSDFGNIADEDMWITLNKGHQSTTLASSHLSDRSRPSSGSAGATRLSLLECQLKDLQLQYDELWSSNCAQLEESQRLNQEVQQARDELAKVLQEKMSLKIEFSRQLELQKELKVSVEELESSFSGAKIVMSSMVEILADSLHFQRQLLLTLEDSTNVDHVLQNETMSALDTPICDLDGNALKLKESQSEVGTCGSHHSEHRCDSIDFQHRCKDIHRLSTEAGTTRDLIDCSKAGFELEESFDNENARVHAAENGCCANSHSYLKQPICEHFHSSTLEVPNNWNNCPDLVHSKSAMLEVVRHGSSSPEGFTLETEQRMAGENLDEDTVSKSLEKADFFPEPLQPLSSGSRKDTLATSLISAVLPSSTSMDRLASGTYGPEKKLVLRNLERSPEENVWLPFSTLSFDRPSYMPYGLLHPATTDNPPNRASGANDITFQILSRHCTKVAVSNPSIKLHQETNEVKSCSQLLTTEVQPMALPLDGNHEDNLLSNDKLMSSRKGNSCTKEVQSYLQRLTMNECGFNPQVLAKIETVKALEANLAAAELEVVELKVEIEDMRTRMQMCDGCTNNNVGSKMELELQSLRIECEKYKEEMQFVVEQYAALDDNENLNFTTVQHLLEENSSLQSALAKAKQRLLRTKAWRQELKMLRAVEKQAAAVSARVEDPLIAKPCLNCTSGGSIEGHVCVCLSRPVRPALEEIDVNGRRVQGRNSKRSLKRRRHQDSNTEIFGSNKENLPAIYAV